MKVKESFNFVTLVGDRSDNLPLSGVPPLSRDYRVDSCRVFSDKGLLTPVHLLKKHLLGLRSDRWTTRVCTLVGGVVPVDSDRV